jgi:triacylglycerol esterase/lipase EstA (alpha/beta hydrolase family)
MFAAAGGVLAVALTVTIPSAAAQAQTDYPVIPSLIAGAAAALPDPAAPPPGANIAGCQSSAHPTPVVLVNGTFANAIDDFGGLAPTLANAGYCVYTFSYGAPASQLIQSIGPVPASAQELADYVQQVLAETGASKVDLVGHSQGGMLTEYYTKLLGGAQYVRDLVALSPTTHGTTLDGLANLAQAIPGANQFVGALCHACTDQETGSAVINALDDGPIAEAGVNYTVIETLDEFVVTPVGSSFINEPDVTNEYVQQFCPLDPVDHADLTYDPVVLRLIMNALDPSAARYPNCFDEFPAPA